MIERINKLEKQTPAFSRLEFLASLGAVALFLTVIVPTIAGSGSRGDRVVCFNNLRQIGVAFAQFGLDHDERTPWRVSSSQGGNMDHPLKANVGIQMSVLSNSLTTPKVLMDPAETRAGARPATHWGSASGGFLQLGNNSVSYFLGLDGSFSLPSSILAGDRNVQAQTGLGCSSGIVPAAQIVTPNPWTNDVHGLSGNIVRFDGSAAQVDSKGLEDALRAGRDDSVGGIPPRGHVLIP